MKVFERRDDRAHQIWAGQVPAEIMSSEINKDEPRTLSSSPEKDTIGKALENPDVWKLYMNHIRDCLKF